MFTLINFLFFSINIFVKIVSRVFIFGVLAYSSFFIFFVIILISFSLLESTVSLVESEYTFFMNSLFIYITIMSVYLIFDYFKPFLAKIIKKIKIELNNNINIVTLMQKQEQEYENEVMKDKLLIKGLLKGIFNSILSTFKLIFIICLILTPFLLVFIILGGISFMMGSFNESNIFLEILMIIFKHIGFTILFKYFFI